MKKLLILVLGITSLVCPSAKAQYASGSASHSYTVGIGTETSFTYAIVAQTASWSSFSTSTASVSAYKNSVGVSDIEVIYTSVYHL